MTLYEKIIALYPELTPIPDENGRITNTAFSTVIRLQNDNDGKGDYIASWEHPTLTCPTEEQLNAN
jgi:hypothetical protein